ncbi:hypothetical protein [Actinomycetospora soli]|uniref:hypothetical protein n=1 Tax=Actinomycetospora soli TaxID=2893887 RepID=UPI001E3F49F0|nr:hypothetical protein [Actinomycetospora soli]MCD2191347.1 hypothetical protein [Actinomycetospora soli]
MPTVTALILFSGVAAVLCARSKATGPALLFGVLAVVLIGTTQLGRDLLTAVSSVGDRVDDAAAAAGASRG